MSKLAWLLMVVCVAGALAAPGNKDKEKEIITKKKLLVKPKSDLEGLETADVKTLEAVLVTDKLEVTEKKKEDSKKDSSTGAEAEAEKDQETAGVVEVVVTTAVDRPKPSYMTRVKSLLKRLLEIFGFIAKRREARAMGSINRLDNEPPYTKEVKTAVGAILGKEECMKQTACGAGSLLRHIRGKELLIILLEKFSPISWSDSVNQIRNAAIHKDSCDYKCLDEY